MDTCQYTVETFYEANIPPASITKHIGHARAMQAYAYKMGI